MPTAPIPRSHTSARFAAIRAERDAYEQHLTAVQAAEVRVGAQGWVWRIARRDPGGPWRVLDAELEHFPQVDVAQERRRLVPWLRDTLGVRSVFLWPDRAAEDAGRVAFEVQVTG